MFSERTYSVDEDDGPAQPVLVLSNPSATPFNVTVTSTDGSATGEYCSILINYSYYNQEFIIVREEVSVLLYNNLPYSTKVSWLDHRLNLKNLNICVKNVHYSIYSRSPSQHLYIKNYH